MPDFPDTSYSLIERVQDPLDEVAWVEFLGIYQPVVYRMARRRGLQDADAQDVMQQVFVSIARSIDGWEPGESQPPFRAWLTTITRNTITNTLGRQPKDCASGSPSVVKVLNAQPAREDTTTEVIKETRREIVRWATENIRSEFTERTWNIFWKTSVEGVAIAEVASSAGRSVGAIYVTRHRVISRLREKIAEVSQQWDGSDLEG